jgi:2-dehydropantoate 2-reductase
VVLIGVGGVGGVVAAALEHAGRCDLTVVARGATLQALRAEGLVVRMPYKQAQPPHQQNQVEYHCRPRAASFEELAAEGSELRPDFIFCVTKAHQLPPLVSQLLPLLGADTVVVPCMNGIPFWYFYGLPGVKDRPVYAVDPEARLHSEVGSWRAIGCVVRVGGSVAAPGVVVSAGASSTLEFGEPSGAATPRLASLLGLFDDAEDKPVPFAVTTRRPTIRDALWDKLVYNVVGNPLQTLTQATCGDLVADPKLRALCAEMMGATQTPPPTRPLATCAEGDGCCR